MYIYVCIYIHLHTHTHTQQYSRDEEMKILPEIIEVILLSPEPTPFRRRRRQPITRIKVKAEPSDSGEHLDEASAEEQLTWQQVEDTWRYDS